MRRRSIVVPHDPSVHFYHWSLIHDFVIALFYATIVINLLTLLTHMRAHRRARHSTSLPMVTVRRDVGDWMVCRLSEVTLKNRKGLVVELSPTMPANTAELVTSIVKSVCCLLLEQATSLFGVGSVRYYNSIQYSNVSLHYLQVVITRSYISSFARSNTLTSLHLIAIPSHRRRFDGACRPRFAARARLRPLSPSWYLFGD